jgi:anti-sigma regulatory factor (Ser/Thr protein kinase)
MCGYRFGGLGRVGFSVAGEAMEAGLGVSMMEQASFPATPAAVRSARQLVARALRDATPAVLDIAVLLTSELATNAVLHARTPFELRITDGGSTVRVEVADGQSRLPVMRNYGPESPTGRGLRLLQSGASRWGVERVTGGGKSVWFEIDTTEMDAEGLTQ